MGRIRYSREYFVPYNNEKVSMIMHDLAELEWHWREQLLPINNEMGYQYDGIFRLPEDVLREEEEEGQTTVAADICTTLGTLETFRYWQTSCTYDVNEDYTTYEFGCTNPCGHRPCTGTITVRIHWSLEEIYIRCRHDRLHEGKEFRRLDQLEHDFRMFLREDDSEKVDYATTLVLPEQYREDGVKLALEVRNKIRAVDGNHYSLSRVYDYSPKRYGKATSYVMRCTLYQSKCKGRILIRICFDLGELHVQVLHDVKHLNEKPIIPCYEHCDVHPQAQKEQQPMRLPFRLLDMRAKRPNRYSGRYAIGCLNLILRRLERVPSNGLPVGRGRYSVLIQRLFDFFCDQVARHTPVDNVIWNFRERFPKLPVGRRTVMSCWKKVKTLINNGPAQHEEYGLADGDDYQYESDKEVDASERYSPKWTASNVSADMFDDESSEEWVPFSSPKRRRIDAFASTSASDDGYQSMTGGYDPHVTDGSARAYADDLIFDANNDNASLKDNVTNSSSDSNDLSGSDTDDGETVARKIERTPSLTDHAMKANQSQRSETRDLSDMFAIKASESASEQEEEEEEEDNDDDSEDYNDDYDSDEVDYKAMWLSQ
ncbi:hypothetical protein BCR43DRAFT_566446 [Syncephalastrum racemosum]|uniref:Uncharacterized protein n=1 Tax=Syncephalastrum racemosum TaxID=13706 RepID=A0A1X2H326_SYNRA|nr:hypothetical protein BCR43DRAFT_566446 [Syncephalastrum racemosum]